MANHFHGEVAIDNGASRFPVATDHETVSPVATTTLKKERKSVRNYRPTSEKSIADAITTNEAKQRLENVEEIGQTAPEKGNEMADKSREWGILSNEVAHIFRL
ncbi:hypothetical protein JTE90_008427 [Oedothorax gibbosus]|uniref:Uncharacterized protein n=1 Tax=Oedothorax gibbosus TaxID=931172 RepID=A0AAV6UTF3_9ARAC|nr:hypothetical protein JTE90_008427 [Oedothorax gibbosus]